MDIYSKNKYLFWAVIILIVLNIILITITSGIYFDRKMPPPFKPNNEMKPDKSHLKEFIINEIDMDDNQKEMFSKIMDEHFNNFDNKMKEINLKRNQVFDEIFSENYDSSKIEILFTDFERLHSEMEKINFEHFIKLKSIFNKDQNVKLKKLFSEIFVHKDRRRPPENHFRDFKGD